MRRMRTIFRACTASLVSCALALAMPMGALGVTAGDAVAAANGIEAPGAALSWELGSPVASSVRADFDVGTGTLELTLAEGCGSSAMADFATAADVPWAAAAPAVQKLVLPEGLTTIGANAFAGMTGLSSVKVPSTVTAVGERAFADCAMAAIDLTACDKLEQIGTGALCQEADGLTVYVARTQYEEAAALVSPASGSAGAWEAGNANPATTALAVADGGSFPEGAEFAAGELCANLQRDGYNFICWCTDPALMHPASDWKPISQHVTYYAKTRAWDVVESPVEYPGYQGFDQQVLLCDASQLPRKVAKQPGVTYYGETASCFDNRFDEPLNGNKNIDFAFATARGSNTNGGDGSYYLSYTLGYISVLDEDGNTVASYSEGNGTLKLRKAIFEGDESKTSGNYITAVRIGLDARTLEAGTYTLRFGAEIGANNGLSFLGKAVDFRFQVDRPVEYELSYSPSGKAVTGISPCAGIDYSVDVALPGDVTAVEAGAFQGAGFVRSVTLPASVAAVGDRAFADMPALEWVKSLSAAADAPAFGAEVFAGSGGDGGLTLYGYSSATSVQAAADAYDNVAFAPIDSGIYANGVLVKAGAAVKLMADAPTAVFTVFAGGQDVTGNCRAYLTNTNVVRHVSPQAGEWHKVTARANGSCELVICSADGGELGTVLLKASGFAAAGGEEQQAVTAGQGNGCTIRMTGVGSKNADPKVTVRAYDERSTLYYDDYLGTKVQAGVASFTFQLAGPGTAWGIDRWDWDDWTSNHLSPFIKLVGSKGKTLATVGNGLYWITLTDSNEITLGVEPGVMTPGKTYTLVAEAGLTGHNVAASLLKPVHWTFTAKKTALSNCSIRPIANQKYTGKALKPAVRVLCPVPERSLWSSAMGCAVTTAATSKALPKAGYTVSYSNNTKLGKAKVKVKGTTAFSGTLKATFKIVRKVAKQK